VGGELCVNAGFGLLQLTDYMHVGLKLRIAALADSDDRDAFGSFYDPQLAFRHDHSLAQPLWQTATSVEIKRHHYPDQPLVDNSASRQANYRIRRKTPLASF